MRKVVTVESRTINSVSKSKLALHDKCPLKAYYAERDTSAFESSQAMEVGVLAHELAAKHVANMYNIHREVNNIEERFSIGVIYQVQEGINYERLSSCYGLKFDLIGVEKSESIQIDEINPGFRVNVRFDAISRATIKHQNYIVVDDFKTGFQLSTEADTEAILYSYIANKLYGLPVIFRRISLFTGKIFSKIFTEESLKRIEPSLFHKITAYKNEMESYYTPEHKPGSHCVYCPFLRRCEGRKHIDSLNNKFKASLIAKFYSSKLEGEVKDAAKELLNELPEGETVLIPFINGGYGAVAKTTHSFQLKGQKLKKSDIIKLLIETGEINNYFDLIDIKINEELADQLKEWGINVTEVVKTTVSLMQKEGDDDEREE